MAVKVLGRGLIGLVILLCLGLVGCSHEETNSDILKKVTTSEPIWYLYQNKGTQNVLSIQFQDDRTAIVKEVDAIGVTDGENRVDDDFANPKFVTQPKTKQITIKTSAPKLVLKLGAKYQKNISQKKMMGYDVTYNGHKNWHLAQIKQDGSDNGGTTIGESASTKTKSKTKKQPAQIKSRLLNYLKDPTKKAEALSDPADAGHYIYRTLAGKNQAYGQLTLNADGTYENAVSVHAIQGTKDSDEAKPIVANYEVQTGHVVLDYGKYYLVPDNLLRIHYYVHGQNPEKPLPEKIVLYTGQHIGLAKTRIEHVGDTYQFYSKDYTPWPDAEATPAAITLTKTDEDLLGLPEIYQAALTQYQDWRQSKLQSNADLMQVVAAIADNRANRVGTTGVNFEGSYGVTQQASDYTGVARDGSQQPAMDYVFAVSPANQTSGTAVIATASGGLLVFGSLNNQLYALHQPDADSTTVTWQAVKDVPLVIPELKVRLND